MEHDDVTVLLVKNGRCSNWTLHSVIEAMTKESSTQTKVTAGLPTLAAQRGVGGVRTNPDITPAVPSRGGGDMKRILESLEEDFSATNSSSSSSYYKKESNMEPSSSSQDWPERKRKQPLPSSQYNNPYAMKDHNGGDVKKSKNQIDS